MSFDGKYALNTGGSPRLSRQASKILRLLAMLLLALAGLGTYMLFYSCPPA